VHGGANPNFKVNSETGEWFCHSKCGRGGGVIQLEQALTAADFNVAKAEVLRVISRTNRSLYARVTNRQQPALLTKTKTLAQTANQWKEVSRYPYQDRDGTLLCEIVREEDSEGNKRFKACRPDGHGGSIPNIDGITQVPYRLPKVLEADTVYLVEGEKDVHTLEGWGLISSCNPFGARNSRVYETWTDHFRGRHIVILPDNDEAGRKHAADVAAALLDVASTVRVVTLPGLHEKGDITDWKESGGTAQQLAELIKSKTPMDAAALSDLHARWGLADVRPKAISRAETGSLITRRMSDIEARPVSWLWPRRIARGKMSIIAGNPGVGKSQLTASIAAIATTGARWPVDGSTCTPGDVVFLSAEDDPADTIRPRLEAAGADLNRVHVMEAVISGYTGKGLQQNRGFNMKQDLDALSNKIRELGDVAVVVIDPVSAYLGEVDSHRNADVRALLAPLSAVAEQHNVAIVCVSHLNKSAASEALMRVTGSLAFVAAARAAFLVTQDPENPARRLFLPMKNNIGPNSKGLAFRIDMTIVESGAGPIETSRVVWESESVTITADDIIKTLAPKQGAALRAAEDWLRDVLIEPTPSAKIFGMAHNVGIADKTLRRAFKSINAFSHKVGMTGGWIWSLSAKTLVEREDAQ